MQSLDHYLALFERYSGRATELLTNTNSGQATIYAQLAVAAATAAQATAQDTALKTVGEVLHTVTCDPQPTPAVLADPAAVLALVSALPEEWLAAAKDTPDSDPQVTSSTEEAESEGASLAYRACAAQLSDALAGRR